MAVANAYAMQMATIPPPHMTTIPSSYPAAIGSSIACQSAPGLNNVVQWISDRPGQMSSSLFPPFSHQSVMQSKTKGLMSNRIFYNNAFRN